VTPAHVLVFVAVLASTAVPAAGAESAAAAQPVAAESAAVAVDPNGPSCVLGSQILEAYGIGTPWADLARMAQDVGAAPLRPDLFQRPGDRAIPVCADGPRLPMGRQVEAPGPGLALDLVPATLSVYGNTAYPSGANDGAVWQGKGVSAQLGVGLQFQYGILSAAFVPGVAWQQNVPFPILPTGQTGNLAYQNPFYGSALDVPQRFGDANYWTFTPGQSYVQIAYAGIGLGVSTENLWWGPGQRNTLLMSNNADGFPHAYLGTVRPVDIWVGNLEVDLWFGRLDRSKYFYTQDHAWIGALTASLELRWVRGLYLGVVAVNLASDLCGGGCDRNSNTLVGAYGRWVLPSAGFEVYGEWTREDAWVSTWDFLKELDHSAGYTLGLQKVFLGSDYWVRLIAEITDNNIPRPPRDWRPNPTAYYTHGGNTNYTNGGAILGSAIGPGGSTQYLGVDVLTPSGWYGGWLERTRRNDVYFTFVSAGEEPDVELGLGARYVKSIGPFDVGAVAGLAHREGHDGLAPAWNFHGELQFTFWPGKPLL
jgi:hypothetical protein